ncbi:MmgE/PrpD family protein [Xanthomonas sp. CFBP 8445]|uniref:MmgE/PrpD family protein n=1 Tax=Xanthomonas sp. CFBP 8445 TaxID=2971236 RepID=UPI0021E0906D|nr:MmgE/PrpD family protein [Xanthomonas sp. CFBP 8445]UYC11833.1 MmgE/PrpD family protein [Xanthomonas sp. CFBP 8445]
MPESYMFRRAQAPDGTASGVAHALASFIVGARERQLLPATREAALKCVLDALGSAGAAMDVPGLAATRDGAKRLLGRGAVPIWFSGSSGTLGAALLANSAATAALDLDDGYRRARGHPGAAVVPAALAMLTLRPALSADDILGAIVAAYEVALRVAMARLSYAPSGAWSAYGAIAALGYLQGTSLGCLAHALAIAAQASPALPALAGLAGSDVKEGIPFGCLAGLAALEMAAAGATGPTDIFDIPTLFNGDVALADFGPAPLIEGTYFKPFGCCRHIHGALDALLLLQDEHGFTAEDIDGMEVATYRATFNLANRPAPTSLTDAQYSVPFCLAAMAIGGEGALLPLKQTMLSDPRIVRLARTVVVQADPELEALFPARSPSRLSVTLRTGERFVSPVVDPRGDPARPMHRPELVAKFRQVTAHTLGPRQEQVLQALQQFEQGETAPLVRVLGLDWTK